MPPAAPHAVSQITVFRRLPIITSRDVTNIRPTVKRFFSNGWERDLSYQKKIVDIDVI